MEKDSNVDVSNTLRGKGVEDPEMTVLVATSMAVSSCACSAGPHPIIHGFDNDGKQFVSIPVTNDVLSSFLVQLVQNAGIPVSGVTVELPAKAELDS